MTRLAAILAALTFVPALALADYGSATVSEVTSIYDADTFRADIAGWPPIIGERIPVRVLSINAPELRSRCDTEAEKEREEVLARQAKQFTVEALRSAERIELRRLDRGSFFRVMAEVYVDGESLGDQLMTAGLAIPYVEGQGGKAWCGR
ncbi:MAG: thermonuclease family protein [Pseudomonadota bacterium]|nr:thermonuclease family protein [Pseudomonadota bacterium]